MSYENAVHNIIRRLNALSILRIQYGQISPNYFIISKALCTFKYHKNIYF